MHVLLRINRTKNSQNHQGPLTKSPENFLFFSYLSVFSEQ